MRLRLVLGESMRSVQASMSTTVAATLTVLIGMFVLGLTIALGTWVLSWSDHVKKQLLVQEYFCVAGEKSCPRSATPQEIESSRRFLAQDQRVKSFTFVSSAQALKEMRRKFPDLVANLSSNPLPPS